MNERMGLARINRFSNSPCLLSNRYLELFCCTFPSLDIFCSNQMSAAPSSELPFQQNTCLQLRARLAEQEPKNAKEQARAFDKFKLVSTSVSCATNSRSSFRRKKKDKSETKVRQLFSQTSVGSTFFVAWHFKKNRREMEIRFFRRWGDSESPSLKQTKNCPDLFRISKWRAVVVDTDVRTRRGWTIDI